jgi:hypothetical protein
MGVAFEEIVCFRESTVQTDVPRLGHFSSSSTDDFVVRLKFTTPNIGASSFQFEINNAYWYPRESGGSALNLSDHNDNAYFLYAISESDSEYIGYNPQTSDSQKPYDGFVLAKDDNTVDLSTAGWYTLYCDEIEKVLLPNKTYYLWLFPNFRKHYYYWYFNEAQVKYNYSLDGAAGLVWIDVETTHILALIYIDDGQKWMYALPVFYSGSGTELEVIDEGNGSIRVNCSDILVIDDGNGNITLESSSVSVVSDDTGNVILR